MVTSQELQDDEGIGEVEAQHRMTVIEAPGESRTPLMCAVVVPLAGLYFCIDGILNPQRAGNAVFGFLLIPLGFLLLLFGYDGLTTWIPRAASEGLVPPRRSILTVWRLQAPPPIPWADITSAAVEGPGYFGIGDVASPSLTLDVRTRKGRKYELRRRYYPEAFDAVAAALLARGLIKDWIPDLPRGRAPPPSAESLAIPVTLRRVLWDATQLRRKLRLAVAAHGVLLLLITFAWLFTLLPYIGYGFDLILLVPIGIAAFVAYNLIGLIVKFPSATDTEVEPGRLRLGFSKRPELKGWRDLNEVTLVAIEPSDELVAVARDAIVISGGSSRKKKAGFRKVGVWACFGGLLLVTSDEVHIGLRRGKAAHTILEHWRASRTATAIARARAQG